VRQSLDKADKVLDYANTRVEKIKNSVMGFSSFLKAGFISWQRNLILKKNDNTKESDLVLTNSGLCMGGGTTYGNYNYNYLLDWCFVAGFGTISDNGGDLGKYQQGSIPVFGAAVSPGFSLLFSKKKTELGFKIPMYFLAQELEEPSGFSFEEKGNFFVLGSIFSRWHLDTYFFEVEFSKFIDQDSSMWQFGIGRKF
jgi:hypothetical protein